MILEVDSIYFESGEKQILSGCSFSLTENETVGLFGRNGCGKSTLMEGVFGIKKQKYGHVKLDGVPFKSRSSFLKLVKYLPQTGFLPKNLKVSSVFNLLEIEPKAQEEILHLIQPSEKDRRVSDLSHGQIRVLEIFLLLNSKARFLLMDEPFSGLSPIMIEKVVELLSNTNFKKGILITDHNYESILACSDRYLMMLNGAVKPFQDKEELALYGYLRP